jgi:hypothetical protein
LYWKVLPAIVQSFLSSHFEGGGGGGAILKALPAAASAAAAADSCQ